MNAQEPGLGARIRYTCGARLPEPWRDWVRRDLTEPGWRERVVARAVLTVLPFIAVGAFAPGPTWVHVGVPVLMLAGVLLISGSFAQEIRDARLKRYGLTPPPGPTDGPPPPPSWPGMRS